MQKVLALTVPGAGAEVLTVLEVLVLTVPGAEGAEVQKVLVLTVLEVPC